MILQGTAPAACRCRLGLGTLTSKQGRLLNRSTSCRILPSPELTRSVRLLTGAHLDPVRVFPCFTVWSSLQPHSFCGRVELDCPCHAPCQSGSDGPPKHTVFLSALRPLDPCNWCACSLIHDPSPSFSRRWNSGTYAMPLLSPFFATGFALAAIYFVRQACFPVYAEHRTLVFPEVIFSMVLRSRT